MAQVIQPEVWVEGIDDNRLLPSRYTTGLFIGNIHGPNKSIANNPGACRVYDMQITDAIFDYDDRRINGHNNLSGQTFNVDGRDGWGASAYGVFQDVRWDSRVYTMGRHRSIAMRVFDEMQYSGYIGDWGDRTTSNVITSGQNLMNTAATLSKAMDIWKQQVLGPDMDRYHLFAVLNGHISGRWVQNDPTSIFSDDGQWIAQPGPVQGQAIPPQFAPIHCMEWDDNNIPLLLQNLKVTWNNLFIPQDNRVIVIDPYYEGRLLQALTGSGVPATESAYSDIQNGSFTRLMGWDFNFEIPSQYWPHLYVDDNLNVVHSSTKAGANAIDALINSTDHTSDGDKKLLLELADADRMNRPNYIKTIWDPTDGEFKKIVTNYPLGMPAASDYLGTAEAADIDNYGLPTTYPWVSPGAGYGLDPSDATGPIIAGTAPTRVQVIGMALYKKAAQLSQEYSEMRTEDGGTRGKFTEMVMDVKYDAWVIHGLSHGIIPIIDVDANTGEFAIPVKIVGQIEMDTDGD